MRAIHLIGYHATDVEFHGHLAPGTKIHLDNKYTYNVRYGKDGVCTAVLECGVFDKEAPERFSVKLIVEGNFSFSDGYTKEQLHVMTYKELFPYARALAASITAVSGIPPVMLPEIDIESQSIYRIDTESLKP